MELAPRMNNEQDAKNYSSIGMTEHSQQFSVTCALAVVDCIINVTFGLRACQNGPNLRESCRSSSQWRQSTIRIRFEVIMYIVRCVGLAQLVLSSSAVVLPRRTNATRRRTWKRHPREGVTNVKIQKSWLPTLCRSGGIDWDIGHSR
jgi:hypothetical protein